MKMDYRYQVGDEIKTVTVERKNGRFLVTVDGETFDVGVASSEPNLFNLEIGGRRWRTVVGHRENKRCVALNGDVWRIERVTETRRQRSGSGGAASGGLESAMPGQVLDVLVSVGDAVLAGDTLVLLEAMKMELRITAPMDGTVKAVHCAAGETVNRGQLLVEMASDE